MRLDPVTLNTGWASPSTNCCATAGVAARSTPIVAAITTAREEVNDVRIAAYLLGRGLWALHRVTKLNLFQVQGYAGIPVLVYKYPRRSIGSDMVFAAARPRRRYRRTTQRPHETSFARYGIAARHSRAEVDYVRCAAAGAHAACGQ